MCIQVWTVYCEAAGSLHPVTSNAYRAANSTAMEFWVKIMPTITHLLSVSEDVSSIKRNLKGLQRWPHMQWHLKWSNSVS